MASRLALFWTRSTTIGLPASAVPRFSPTLNKISSPTSTFMAARSFSSGQFDNNVVFVGNIPSSADEDSLKELLGQYGEIFHIKIPRTDNRNRGYAFVEFATPDAASKLVVQGPGNVKAAGRDLRFSYAETKRTPQREPRGPPPERPPMEPSQTIYVSNLSFSETSDSLSSVFSKYGPVESCRILAFPDTGRSKGRGFIQFKDLDAAKAAVEESGFSLNGRTIFVNFAAPREVRN